LSPAAVPARFDDVLGELKLRAESVVLNTCLGVANKVVLDLLVGSPDTWFFAGAHGHSNDSLFLRSNQLADRGIVWAALEAHYEVHAESGRNLGKDFGLAFVTTVLDSRDCGVAGANQGGKLLLRNATFGSVPEYDAGNSLIRRKLALDSGIFRILLTTLLLRFMG